MSDYFNELVDQLCKNHVFINPPYLHGLLTGFATTPEPDPEKTVHGDFGGTAASGLSPG